MPPKPLTERDPRVDPRPGDHLRIRGDSRIVKRVREATGWFDVYYCRVLMVAGPMQMSIRDYRCCSDSWRKWAKNAEVIHVEE